MYATTVRPQLLPQVDGQIETLLFAPSSFHPARKKLPSPFREIVEALKNADPTRELHVHIWGQSRLGDPFRPIPSPATTFPQIEDEIRGIHLNVVRAGFDPNRYHQLISGIAEKIESGASITPSEWVQDPFCVVKMCNGIHGLVQPYYSNRGADSFLARELASSEYPHFVLVPSPFWIEGGNILGGGNWALVGKDLLAQNCLELIRLYGPDGASKVRLNRFKKEFQDLLGVDQLLWLGLPNLAKDVLKPEKSTFQPFFHLDLFVTLAGKNALGEEVVLLGDPIWFNSKGIKFSEKEKVLVEQMQLVRDEFDELENQSGIRFKLVSVPLPLVDHIPFSYNNCLTESILGRKIAYLPSYIQDRIPNDPINTFLVDIEKEVKAKFLQAGFDRVIMVKAGADFRYFSQREGSLHCISKVLSRS